MDSSKLRVLTDRLTAVAQGDDRIRALLVYGSHATGTADEFSDLDIGLVIADVAYEDVLARPSWCGRSVNRSSWRISAIRPTCTSSCPMARTSS
ncbi:MAG: nucleotidyltransferase domain-containing protein [Chloroflexi bacterium]|nr:nucleotidyltransferase domain-containing protein [Chloroflexota bacterium]